jgi:hypothetical protein
MRALESEPQWKEQEANSREDKRRDHAFRKRP